MCCSKVTTLLTIAVAATQSGAQRECSNLPNELVGPAHDLKVTAGSPRRVITADFDLDGDIDILTAACGDSTLSWFQNEGGTPPALTEVVIDDMGDCFQDVAVGDVDADGINDVVAASWYDNTIAWYKFRGSFPFSFTKEVLTTSATNAVTVAVGDLDGDGDLDIVYGDRTGDPLSYFENMGGATEFTRHIIPSSIESANDVQTADVDNDGDLDILIASALDGVAAWFENLGGSPLVFRQRTITVKPGANDIDAIDFDHDGDLDILLAGLSDRVSWYESDGLTPPTFTEHLIASVVNPRSVAVADFDNDGDYDVVFARQLSSIGDFSLFWGENDGTNLVFSQIWIADIYAYSSSAYHAYLATGDLDGDGDEDIIMTSRNNDLVRWYENDCTPKTGPTARPVASPSGLPTVLPVPMPTPPPTFPPSAAPTTSMMPTIPPTSSAPTLSLQPTIYPTPAPSGTPACDDGAVDETLAFCQAYIDKYGS